MPLGKLSAGLLHEINNPLNFTFMALQVAEGEAGENEEPQDTLKDINQGMERIRDGHLGSSRLCLSIQADGHAGILNRRDFDDGTAPHRS